MEMKPEVLILGGLPGCGKTTRALGWLAENPEGRVRLNYDDLRRELFGEDWKWNRKEEEYMKQVAEIRFIRALDAGKSVVVDNTNLTERVRNHWKHLAAGATIVEEELDVPVAECVRRDALREGNRRVGRAVIERMALFNGFIDWNDRDLYPRDFIVVDMDGTVADCDWRRKLAFEGPTQHRNIEYYQDGAVFKSREVAECSLKGKVMDRECPKCGGKSKKNWPLFYSNVEKDPPIWPIIELVGRMQEPMSHEGGYDALVVSGRSLDLCGKGTELWLEDKPIRVRHLFMRAAQDYRPDDIIKQEILDLLPKDRIKYVFDDRQRVVDMWRRNGLTCLQVADGNF